MFRPGRQLKLAALLLFARLFAFGEVCNLRIVTDASPDYSDLPSLLHSITAKWPSAREKCWAIFYWNHIGRRQTAPMILHGLELTDPIRQFNDYGYTMCSTISGINCALWHNLGLPVKFWDISLHTVPEVFYAGAWHMYDNSMSALYTLCDGKTIAGVEQIGQAAACAASHGRIERGHVAKYHCLFSTGPNGYLTGADTQRSLEEEANCFNPNGLKYRDYYFNWDYGHRYILNLKAGESYTRFYQRLGETPAFYVPNDNKDPDDRYHLRANGIWDFHPDLKRGCRDVYSSRNLEWSSNGLRPGRPGESAEIIFKVQGANVITSQSIEGELIRKNSKDTAGISLSINNGLSWREVWKASGLGVLHPRISLTEPVNGSYETLVKIQLNASQAASDLTLSDFRVRTTTMLNGKTQPNLKLGRNTVYVDAGEPTDSVVFWPELQGGKYRREIVEESNIACAAQHPGYQGVIYPAKPGKDAFVIYRVDTPGTMVRVRFGGRFYNRASGSRIDLLYSLDGGANWTAAWSLQRTNAPWDVVHYESVDLRPGNKSIRVKYLMNSTDASPAGCSIYALRLEANYIPADTNFQLFQVCFNWLEPQKQGGSIERSHTQTIPQLPFKYCINVGGEDHPRVNWLQVAQKKGLGREGYSDGTDVGGEKFIPKWQTCGENLALGKSYTLSVASATNWGAGDPDGKKLTRGAGGPSYAGGSSYAAGALWMENANPAIEVDLGSVLECASFGLNFHGYPAWDALKGEIRDKVEVRTSLEGAEYVRQGFLKTDVRWIDLPVNYMWTDEETLTSGTFRCIPRQPVKARYVQFRIINRRIFACAGIEVLDSISFAPFDLRLALPDEARPVLDLAPPDDGLENSGRGSRHP